MRNFNKSNVEKANMHNINALRLICLLGGIITPIVTFLWKYEYPQMKSSVLNGWIFTALFFIILILSFTNKFVKKNVLFFSHTLFYLSSFSGLFFAYLNKFSEGYSMLMILVVFSVAWIFDRPIHLLIYESTMFVSITIALIATNKSQLNSVIILSMVIIFGFFAYLNLNSKVNIQRKLEYLSYHDKLTDVYNRAYFEETLQRFESDKTIPVGLVIGDANCLKIANDVLGHKVGDELLQCMAKILLECSDKSSIICRIGGDEFAIILPYSDGRKISEICTQIKERCANETSISIPPSIALGYAIRTNTDEYFDDIFKTAETNMYKNKHLESEDVRNSIVSYMKDNLKGKSTDDIEHRKRLSELFLR